MMKWMSLIVVALFCIADATALPANKYNLIIAPVGYAYGECGYIVMG